MKLTMRDVERHFPNMLRAWMQRFGLGDWEIRILAGAIDNEYATCEAHAYVHHRCRCDPCKQANRKYLREWNAKRR